MPWFRLDDSFHSHPKVIAAGNEAIGLYVRCGTYAAEHLTDGFIPEHVALLYGSAALADKLVRTKLWRRARGGWRMPDYLDYNPSKESVQAERKINARRQALFRDPRLKQAIRDRDGSLCRYCTITVRWGKGQAHDSGTYDHVDPKGDNTLENLVVACLGCNSAKKDRTPAEAGMTLLNPPARTTSRKASTEASGEALPTRPDPYLSTGSYQRAGPSYPQAAKPGFFDSNGQNGAAARSPSSRTPAQAIAEALHPEDP